MAEGRLPGAIGSARVEFSYWAEPLSILRGVFAAGALAWLLSPHVPRTPLAAWAACAGMVFALRVVALRMYDSGNAALLVRLGEDVLRVRETVTGALWIVLGFLAAAYAPHRPEFPHLIFYLMSSYLLMGVPFERIKPLDLVCYVVAIASPLVFLHWRDGGQNELLFRVSMGYAVLTALAGLFVQSRTLDTVDERARNLARLNEVESQADALRRAAQARTRFLAGVAHDVRQPLQAMLLFAESLQSRVQGAEARSIAAALSRSAATMNGMMGALLDISKLEAGTARPVHATVPMAQVLAALREHVADRDAAAATRFKARPCSMSAYTDPALLGRVLEILVDTAFEGTREGAVFVGCRRRREALEVQVICSGRFARLDAVAGLDLQLARRIAASLGHPVTEATLPGGAMRIGLVVPLAAPREQVAEATPGVPLRIRLETLDSSYLTNYLGAFGGAYSAVMFALLLEREMGWTALAPWLWTVLTVYGARMVLGLLYFRFSRTHHAERVATHAGDVLSGILTLVTVLWGVLSVLVVLHSPGLAPFAFVIFVAGVVRVGHATWSMLATPSLVFSNPGRIAFTFPHLLFLFNVTAPLGLLAIVDPRPGTILPAVAAAAYVTLALVKLDDIRGRILAGRDSRYRRLDLLNSLTTIRRDIEQATRDLGAQKEALERAERAKAEFMSGVAHQLRQPLQAITMNATALRHRVGTEGAGGMLAKLGACAEAVEQLFDTIVASAGALEEARVERSHFALEPLLERLRCQLAPQAAETGTRLAVLKCSATVYTDPVLLMRIVGNLASNAVRYAEGGRVVVGCRRRGEGVEIQVFDNGPGIPPHRIPEIFREFHQLESGTAQSRQGVGLGLAIVERTAYRLGHRLTVASAVGRGTAFAIEVPHGSHLKAAAPDAAPDAAAMPFSGQVVVAIDDDPQVLEALRRLLGDWGLVAHAAPDAEAALRRLREAGATPDLIISDFRLGPGGSGLDAIGRLRECHGEVPAILLSGGLAPQDAQLARQLGYDVLHKPVTPARLRSAIERSLDA